MKERKGRKKNGNPPNNQSFGSSFFLTLFLGTDRVTRKEKYSENIKENNQKNKRGGVERRNVQCGVPAEPEYDLASQQHTCPMKT
jgi:hypothetical protein